MRRKRKWLEDGEQILYSFRKTRKAFIVEYGCGIILVCLAVISYMHNVNFPDIIRKSGFGLGVISLISAEVLRYMYRYKITNEKIIISQGLIRRHKKNVYFHPLGFVPDINVKQSHVQRLLGYGTIDVAAGKDKTFEIKDVSSPHKVMKIIEDLIQRHKKV